MTSALETRDDLAARLGAARLDWIIPRWSAPRAVNAFFTTRYAGLQGDDVSPSNGAPTSSASTTSDGALVRDANLRRALAFLPSAPFWLAQVHGAEVIDADTWSPSVRPRADAALTRQPNVVLAVRVADCLPVLFTERSGTTIAVAHAGWRGLAAGVLENTLNTMACDPADVDVWLGPAIGVRAFEVGPEVREAFLARNAADANAFVEGAAAKWHADLVLIARQRLARAGVSRVAADGRCTATHPQFFSYRRDRGAGRMAAFIWRAEA